LDAGTVKEQKDAMRHNRLASMNEERRTRLHDIYGE
jgi:hypothetical protein